MSQYEPKFEVYYFLMYNVLYFYGFAQCRCTIHSQRIFVSFYWKSVIQVSYAVLRELLLYYYFFIFLFFFKKLHLPTIFFNF